MSEIFIPKTLEELLPNIDNENRRIVAGCTDVIVGERIGKLTYKPTVDINFVKEIQKIYEENDRVYIGSNMVMSEVAENPIIKSNFKLLADAINTIGSPQIRNRATLGGNIQNASPSGDGILALTLLDASLILKSISGSRIISIKDFIKGVGRTDLRNDEFIEYIVISKKYSKYNSYFEKVGLRNAVVISIASMGILYKLKGDIVEDIRIAYGAVAPKILAVEDAENALKGKKLTVENLTKISEIIEERVTPIDDIRASAEYRKKVCKNLIMRLLEVNS